MARSEFLQGSETVGAGQIINIIKYKVKVPLIYYIQQLSIDLAPNNYFPNISFSLIINGISDNNFRNINAQITQSYFPISLPTSIKVETGSLVVWQVEGLSTLGTNTATAYASIMGILK